MNVIGKEQALQFAREHCTYLKDYYLSDIENGAHRHYLDDNLQALKDAFEIEGFSEVVDVYEFREQSGNTFNHEPETYISFDIAQYCIRIIKSDNPRIKPGMVLVPWKDAWNAKTFGLFLDREDKVEGRLKDFKYNDEVRPNFIGKASKKKIEDWVVYLINENEAKRQFIETANAKNLAFQEAVKKRFPNAWLHILDDGWMTECKFNYQLLEIHYTATEGGGFTRQCKVDIMRVPDTKNLLGL